MRARWKESSERIYWLHLSGRVRLEERRLERDSWKRVFQLWLIDRGCNYSGRE